MRIVYLHQYFNTPQDSGSTRSYEFARHLAYAGHEVHVITTDRSEHGHRGWREENVSGVVVHRLHVPYNNAMSQIARIGAFIRFAIGAGGRARRLRADVIFATSTPLTIFIPAWQASLGRKTPIVFEIRDSWPTVPIALGYLRNRGVQILARWLERFAYNHSEQLIALSPGMLEDACAHGANASRISVIPNACDIELFDVDEAIGMYWRQDHGIDGDAPLVVYTGTFGAANDVTYLVELAEATSRILPGVQFAIIGDGAELPKVLQRATELDLLGKIVHVLPPAPKSEIPAVLSAATVATSVVTDNPAMFANSANKFFDALAAGRPIAINHEGWQADLIRDEKIGLVLDRADLNSSATALADTLTDATTLRSLRANARRLARERFDRGTLAQTFISILEHAADRTPRI
ncbi:glycosyltransferase family 4 protein [Microbacterium sp.]|uniref:glycosyltransferase family 4 protein n=1 Tax=Microbacterium sp. TaxID=51671 RepID=UPI002734E697|nr:glycosyltransferase family 4 protein [Microbacterium sp.]MDP3949105.1 glycosyltransferase family 4 protein [Microbacterium sp.]